MRNIPPPLPLSPPSFSLLSPTLSDDHSYINDDQLHSNDDYSFTADDQEMIEVLNVDDHETMNFSASHSPSRRMCIQRDCYNALLEEKEKVNILN